MPERGVADVGARTAVHREAIASLAHDLDGTAGRPGLLGQDGCKAGGVGGAHDDAGTQAGAREVRRVLVGDYSALLQRDNVVGGPCGLLGVRRAEQDGSALGRVGAQHGVHPRGLSGGKGARGIVEHQGVRVGEQCAGQSEAPVHAPGEGAEAFVAQAHEADGLEDFVGPSDGDAGGRAEHAQMAADRTGRVPRHVSQQNADLPHGVGDAVQGAASEVGEPASALEFEHESERRGLAGARGSEQCGDAARTCLEGDVVDGGRKLLAGVAGQSEGLDHP